MNDEVEVKSEESTRRAGPKMFRAFAAVGGWTMASRILGLLREMLLSRALGASSGPIADAFLTAFRLPNMFRRFLAEGAFNAAFVPIYSKRLKDPKDAGAFAETAFSGLLSIGLALVLLVQIFTPGFVLMLSYGFIGDERFAAAISYSHITIFYIIFMSLGALLSGMLNAHDRFSLAAAAPVLLNVVMIAALLLMLVFDPGSEFRRGLWLSWAVFIGGVLQLSLLMLGVRKLGLSPRLRLPRWNADMKHLVMVAIPAMLANGVTQINLVVGAQIASDEQGAQAWLYFSDRLYQLPLGVIGIAIGVVLLPVLSKLIRDEQYDAARERFNEAVLFSALFAFPAGVALLVIPLPLIRVLFEGGEFTSEDSLASARALAIYALGLPAFILQKSLQPLFFAREDTRTPLRYAVWSMIINVALALALMGHIGYMAPVWSSVISAWAMIIMLWLGSRRFGDTASLSRASLRNIARFFIAAICMGIMLYFGAIWLEGFFAHGLYKWPAILGLIVLAMGFYFASVLKFTHISLADLRALARR